MSRYSKFIFELIIGISLIIAFWHLIAKDVLFHVDIARDFLVMEEIVNLKKPTLIGARSGGIPGLFHGPLWFYLNLPSFILGQGDPLFVGAFWVLLYILSLVIVYKCAKTIFDIQTARLSTAIFATAMAPNIYGAFNPFGAVIVSPLFFCFLYLYLKKRKSSFLIITTIALGLGIHFQMAWAMPIATFTFLLIIYQSLKDKKILPIAIFICTIIVSLITFIIFDLRHNFLQIRSLALYLSGKSAMGNLPVTNLIQSRIRGFFIEGLQLTSIEYLPIALVSSTFFIWLFYNIFLYKNSTIKNSLPYKIFFYLYGAYWLSVFFFKGPVWQYYLVPFAPLAVIIFSSLAKVINKHLFYSLYSVIILFNLYHGLMHIQNMKHFTGIDGSSWQFNYQLADKIYSDSKGEFGYYILTPELFGYTPRYAMNYLQKKYPKFKAYPFEKKTVTYLISAPKSEDKPEYDPLWWKKNQVNISTEPAIVFKFENGYIVEKFLLSKNEVAIPSESTLIKDLHFR